MLPRFIRNPDSMPMPLQTSFGDRNVFCGHLQQTFQVPSFVLALELCSKQSIM
jgi:hypothetical protein